MTFKIRHRLFLPGHVEEQAAENKDRRFVLYCRSRHCQ